MEREGGGCPTVPQPFDGAALKNWVSPVYRCRADCKAKYGAADGSLPKHTAMVLLANKDVCGHRDTGYWVRDQSQGLKMFKERKGYLGDDGMDGVTLNA